MNVYRIYNGFGAYRGLTRIVLAETEFDAMEKAIAAGEAPWCKAVLVMFDGFGVEVEPWDPGVVAEPGTQTAR